MNNRIIENTRSEHVKNRKNITAIGVVLFCAKDNENEKIAVIGNGIHGKRVQKI